MAFITAAAVGEIVFTSDRDGIFEICVMSANGSNPVKLTNNPAVDQSPSWPPDGKKIAFVSFRDGVFDEEIYVMDADANNPDTSPRTQHPTNSPHGHRMGIRLPLCQTAMATRKST